MKDKKLSANIKKNIFVYLVILYPMAQFAVFYIGLNFKTISMAFQTVEGGNVVFAGFSNFIEVFNKLKVDPLFITSTINSLKMFALCFIITMPLYIFFAYYIYKKWFLSKTLRFLIMLPNIVSNMIMVLVFKRVVEDVLPAIFGADFPNLLIDGRYAFWITMFFSIWISFSSNVLIYPNAMNSIPPEVIESARLDGVNMVQELWYIILPQIFPTLTTFFVTNVATIFSAGGALLTFYYYDKCPQEAYNMGYYLLVTVMKNTSNTAQMSFAAAAGLLLTLVSAPITWIVKWALEKFGPSED